MEGAGVAAQSDEHMTALIVTSQRIYDDTCTESLADFDSFSGRHGMTLSHLEASCEISQDPLSGKWQDTNGG